MTSVPLSLSRLFVANRGEIARRVIKTARRLGLDAVAGFAAIDADQPFVREASAAVRLEGDTPRGSYLDAAGVLDAAVKAGCDALHPGYGFLSENADFAEGVLRAGLRWIGPPPDAIRAMGLKDAAKARMALAGVPTTPGYLGEDQSAARLRAEAASLGYPVLIKAVAGGGGKGMRRVESDAGFLDALDAARREAASSFGDDRVLLEVYVRQPRHIEVQIFADAYGAVVHLFERDCSLQRRHQKVIEEAPAPGLSDEARAATTQAAVRAAAAVGYVGAGTVEFIADASEGLRSDRIWFMEMNTRLQVEHPVTEMITGVDLVEWQLRVADGQPLPLRQEDIRRRGAAIEARLYAESPAAGFLPSVGRLRRFQLPEETATLRVDAGVEAGGEVTGDFDPLLAKIIAFGADRREAAERLATACARVRSHPVRTNAGFLARCLRHADFLDGRIDTGFIGARLDALVAPPEPSPGALAAAARRLSLEPAPEPGGARSLFAFGGGMDGFRLNAAPATAVFAYLDDRIVEIDASAAGGLEAELEWTGSGVRVFEGGEVYRLEPADAARSVAAAASASDGRLTAPMPGRIVMVAAVKGARVASGEPLVAVEAMKMEHVVAAPFAGCVREVRVRVGDQIREGDLLVLVDPD